MYSRGCRRRSCRRGHPWWVEELSSKTMSETCNEARLDFCRGKLLHMIQGVAKLVTAAGIAAGPFVSTVRSLPHQLPL